MRSSDIHCMSEKLFPERQRCAGCRKKLEDTVVSGIFCSYKCGNAKEPTTNVVNAPKECKRMVSGAWGFKKRYRSESEVPVKLQQDPGTNIYRCQHCLHLHVGHSRPDAFTREKLHRVVGNLDTLGSVLIKMREEKGWDVKRLATHLKVPQARIKEIESGDKNSRMDIAFAALYAVGIRVVLQEK